MIVPGYTFLSPNVKYNTKHLYIIISEIIDGKVLLVNITTQKEHSDTSCILQKGEHRFIRHTSVVNYADAGDAEVCNIKRAISKGTFIPQKLISSSLLRRIHEGALRSTAFEPKYLKYISSE